MAVTGQHFYVAYGTQITVHIIAVNSFAMLKTEMKEGATDSEVPLQ
jgi:hypothetical protein